MNNLSNEVTKFLDGQNHPLRKEIEELRQLILNSKNGLTENIKWNGPNYCFNYQDRLTMKIQPPKQIQLIFHRGAKKLDQPSGKLIDDKSQDSFVGKKMTGLSQHLRILMKLNTWNQNLSML